MLTIILLLAYIGNVFLARYLNYKLIKLEPYEMSMPLLWFIQLSPIVFHLLVWAYTPEKEEKSNKLWNWFTGKHW